MAQLRQQVRQHESRRGEISKAARSPNSPALAGLYKGSLREL